MLPYPLLFWTPGNRRGGPARHVGQNQLTCHNISFTISLNWSCPVGLAHLVWMFLHLFCLVVFWQESDQNSPRFSSWLYSSIRLHLTSSVSFSFSPYRNTKTITVQHNIEDLSTFNIYIWSLSCFTEVNTNCLPVVLVWLVLQFQEWDFSVCITQQYTWLCSMAAKCVL